METQPLESYKAIIAIADIRPPNGRGKSYTILTKDNNEFSIWPDKIGLIRSEEQYEVEVSSKQTDSGRVYHNIVGTPRHIGPYRAPKEQPKQQPKEQKKMDYWTPKPRDPAEQRQIWVCAMLCRDMEGRAGMDEQELVARGLMHGRVWDQLFGSVVVPPSYEEYYRPGGPVRGASDADA